MLDDDFFSEPTHKKEEQAFTKQLGWEGRLKAGDNLGLSVQGEGGQR